MAQALQANAKCSRTGPKSLENKQARLDVSAQHKHCQAAFAECYLEC
jgi:hypothetical protein